MPIIVILLFIPTRPWAQRVMHAEPLHAQSVHCQTKSVQSRSMSSTSVQNLESKYTGQSEGSLDRGPWATFKKKGEVYTGIASLRTSGSFLPTISMVIS